MKKITFDIEDSIIEKAEWEAKKNERSLAAQLRLILKERYSR